MAEAWNLPSKWEVFTQWHSITREMIWIFSPLGCDTLQQGTDTDTKTAAEQTKLHLQDRTQQPHRGRAALSTGQRSNGASVSLKPTQSFFQLHRSWQCIPTKCQYLFRRPHSILITARIPIFSFPQELHLHSVHTFTSHNEVPLCIIITPVKAHRGCGNKSTCIPQKIYVQ